MFEEGAAGLGEREGNGGTGGRGDEKGKRGGGGGGRGGESKGNVHKLCKRGKWDTSAETALREREPLV